MSDYPGMRERMVKRQIAGRGVRSDVVLKAMRKVPRERFLPRGQGPFAYDDSPLPIGDGQTISQPYIVAYMAEALELNGGEKILEIGTGSGYAAAVLAEIAADVYTVERLETLATRAKEVLDDLGYKNIHLRHGDGSLGWPEQAPFDGIMVSAGAPEVPETLKRQLKIGGRLVIPVGANKAIQDLVRVTRVEEAEFESEDLSLVRFVPLIGQEGWQLHF
ncbi:MAG: protein-L-isoaspartate(D-aspartate) O-methyltransferase [Gammaproteobacteria bacterium]|nr:protein-L-isoaspartate(D-aspartate) O-methyltransferase [Gammaproteobacteria bacterium]